MRHVSAAKSPQPAECMVNLAVKTMQRRTSAGLLHPRRSAKSKLSWLEVVDCELAVIDIFAYARTHHALPSILRASPVQVAL